MSNKKQLEAQLKAAEERLQITSQVLAVAEGEVGKRSREKTLTTSELDEAIILLGELRHDYRVAERNLIRVRRELGR